MALDPLARRIRELLDHGSLRESDLSTRMLDQLRTLFDVGALERTRSGGGARIICRNPDAVRAWAGQRYPSGVDGTESTDLPPRALAIANFADAKRAGIAEKTVILLRGFGGATLNATSEVLAVGDMTSKFGVCAIARPDDRLWSFDGRVGVVENLEVFLRAEHILPGLDVAAWATSAVSTRLLKWLGELASSGAQVIHAGDYDPVGLGHFLKIKEACGGEATFFVPDDLEQRVRKWGKRSLIAKSAGVFDQLRQESEPTVRKVVEILERSTKGLEHEALLLPL